MDPEGILKAWTTKVRIKSAKRIAIQIASKYSLNTDLCFPILDKINLLCFERKISENYPRKNYLKYKLITSVFVFA